MEAEPNVTRKKNRLVVPCEDPVFPPICVETGKTDDLAWVSGDLNALSDPTLQKNLLPFAVVAMVVAGGAVPVGTAGRAIAGNTGFFAPSVTFAVSKQYYDKWQMRFRRKSTIGWGLVFVGIGAMIVGIGLGLADPDPRSRAMDIGLGFGAITAAIGGLVRVYGVRPLLHSPRPEGKSHVSVRGASAEFLNKLADFVA